MAVNSIVFGGVDSADYDIYISGEGVFNAPKRDVEMIEIPGRNGAFALDKGRFENIEVTYPAFNFEPGDYNTFAKNLADFRNAICSLKGYQRLTDSFHPNEYRMAVYRDGLEVKPIKYNTASEFDITFDCKPQRWLTSGETAVTIGEWGETETATGDIVTVENEDGILGVKSLKVSLEPIQEGSGTPSPDNVRPISGRTEVETVVSPTTSAEDGTTYTTSLGRTVYGGTLDVVTGELVVDRAMSTLDQTYTWSVENGGMRIKTSGLASVIKHNGANNTLVGAICDKFEERTPNQTWAGGASGIGFSVAPNGDVAFCQTGEKNMGYSDWITFVTNNPIELCYELATPTTYQLTPTEVQLLLGNNNVWSDGEVTVEYGQLPNLLINPTLFESEPLLAVKGYGNIDFNGYNLEIYNAILGDVEVSQALNETKTGVSINRTITIPFINTDLLNPGDIIHISGIKETFVEKVGNYSGIAVTFNSRVGITATRRISKPNVTFSISYNAVDIVYGTASTWETELYADITYTGGSDTVSVYTEFVYNGGDSISITFNQYAYNDTQTISIPVFVGVSTISTLGDPTYLDCEIGEAYLINDDEPVTLNNVVEFGADLPKLGAGANTVTFDNTITELKITPRWWKV